MYYAIIFRTPIEYLLTDPSYKPYSSFTMYINMYAWAHVFYFSVYARTTFSIHRLLRNAFPIQTRSRARFFLFFSFFSYFHRGRKARRCAGEEKGCRRKNDRTAAGIGRGGTDEKVTAVGYAEQKIKKTVQREITSRRRNEKLAVGAYS